MESDNEFISSLDPIQQLTDIVRRERAALMAVAIHEGLTAEEALECVQDALCTWLARRERDSGQDAIDPAGTNSPTLGATLSTMIRNTARNWRRRHRRLKPHFEIDAEIALASSEANAEQLLDFAEDSLRLQTCVAELREVERAVVSLRLLEERSGEDVAKVLGLSRAHVDVLVHRAKATLRVCMRAPNCSPA
jgi:RNA polymerase sigma-70 factor (ECF subfamily)